MSYTKISNNDRRKTARRLRDAANCRNVQISPSALGRLIKAEDRSYRGILRTLADLIDRPVYRPVIPNAMEGYVFCPQCGAPIGEYGVPNYCHSCGVAIRNGH